jgi:hypothetical protein
MKASSFTKSPYTFVPLQTRICSACTSDIYILSGENLAGVYSTTRRLRDQITTQVDNMQGRAGTLYVRLLLLPPWRSLSQWVQLYTGAQINFGDLTTYLTYD